MTSAALLLLGSGVAGAVQTQLLPTMIPQFVEPLPLFNFEFVDATSGGLNSAPFPVNAEEFQAQILPTLANWPTAPATCMVNDPDPFGGIANAGATPGTASWTYGYLSGIANTSGLVRPTYLGPVVIAERGVAVNPTYGNNIPDATVGLMGVVQYNMPIDKTLDWANPDGASGPILCQPDPNGNYQNPMCGWMFPYYNGPMPIATHLHGGEVSPAFDGGPDAWFTQDTTVPGVPDVTGAGFPGYQYNYPTNQQESLIWFHDHALGITRLNVYAGLAGIQPIIDPANPPLTPLPTLAEGLHVPLIIQDRTFDDTCEIFYNLASNPQPNPTVHPFWIPEFIGDTIVVNGKTWPYFEVEPRQYRLSFVNGSNARFYDLSLGGSLKFLVIATDDGYLEKVVSTGNLVIGPGERYEVVVDFRNVKGQKNKPYPTIIMTNIAATPFPAGAPVVPGLTDTVMQFRVNKTLSGTSTEVKAGDPLRNLATNPIYPIVNAHNPATGSITRQLTLNEVIGKGGPLELVVNNSKFNLALPTPGCNTTACRETEIPAVGDTEIWEIINITADAHPMHTHLTSFQVLERIPFKANSWIANYDGLRRSNNVADGAGPPNTYNVKNADGAIGGNPAVGPYLVLKNARPPLPYEMGWKDTVITYPGEVTRIAVRWAPTDMPATGAGAPVVGTNYYDDFPNGGFDPTKLEGGNVGYVWHCHIVDHEDNEMMRNYTVGTVRQPTL